jgi:hypothetical protein
MEKEKIEKYLEMLNKQFKDKKVECSRIHDFGSGHTSNNNHKICFVLGIDVEEEDMYRGRGKGNYLFVDEKGQFHKQGFEQTMDGHDWYKENIITKEDFFDYIKELPKSNLANPEAVISRLEEALK